MIWDDRSVSRRLIWWLLAAAGLYAAVAGVTVAIVRGEPAYAHAGTSAAALFAQLAAGAGLLTAALFLAARRPGRGFPALLVATSIAWPLTAWNSPGAGAAFTVGLVLSAAWPPLLAAAALRGPDERPFGRPTAVLLVVAARDQCRRDGPRLRRGPRPAGPGLRRMPHEPTARRQRHAGLA